MLLLLTNAPTGPNFCFGGDTALGFTYTSAADAFGIDGLKISVSYSTDNLMLLTLLLLQQSGMMGIGATYVTDAGDTLLLLGGGLSGTDYSKTTALLMMK